MKTPASMKALEELGRVQLSPSFFMRDMLYSEISNYHKIPNIPENPDLAIEAGKKLCLELLEPLQDRFGRISIRSAYRSPTLNKFGNENGLNCANNEANFAKHIWDYRDADGNMGALATIVINKYIPYFKETRDWQSLAWYIHDNLPYSTLCFFPKLCALNIGWRENAVRRIDSYIHPKGCLTKPGMDNHAGNHGPLYEKILANL